MKEYIAILRKTILFSGVGEEEIEAMLDCLGAKLARFCKGEFVFREGEYLSQIAVLLDGELHIQRDDFWGNRSIVNRIAAGEMFGEAYISPNSGALLNDVVAVQDSALMFFDVQRILTACQSACKFHTITIKNLFFDISEKNRRLVAKLGHISKRTTREKLLSYLSDEAKRHNSAVFEIPFNRQQLADFLFVDRSAMSNELCKMRDEGLIQFEKNRFRLI